MMQLTFFFALSVLALFAFGAKLAIEAIQAHRTPEAHKVEPARAHGGNG